jgi:hypothetical protein
LVEELDRYDTADDWKQHLKTEVLMSLLPDPREAPAPPRANSPQAKPSRTMDPKLRTQLAGILETFDTASQVSNYKIITSMWGFRAAHVVLRELMKPPMQRSRTQLNQAVELLERNLTELSGGSDWKKYLRLEKLASVARMQQSELTADRIGELKAIEIKFIEVNQKSQFRPISELPGFQYTLSVLRNYTAGLANANPNDTSTEDSVNRLDEPVGSKNSADR